MLGFTTGNNFVVLAVIADKSKELFAKIVPKEERTGNIIDSVLPLAYSFPSVGKLIEIFFILFVAWYVNQTLGIAKHLELAVAGVLSLFGSPRLGIPFLSEGTWNCPVCISICISWLTWSLAGLKCRGDHEYAGPNSRRFISSHPQSRVQRKAHCDGLGRDRPSDGFL